MRLLDAHAKTRVTMRVHIGRKYDAYVFEGRATPWTRAKWKPIAAVLEDIFGEPAKTSVRTGEKLGKLSWKDHAKWVTSATSFSHAEFWSPSWTDFSRTGEPPDAFLQLSNVRSFGRSPRNGTRCFTLLAVARDSERHQHLEGAVTALTSLLDAVRVSHRTAPWARPDIIGFSNSLQDLISTTEFDEHLGLSKAWVHQLVGR